MAVLDRIPSTQVKLVDIRDTINAFGGSASDNLTSFFQENDMNMWAKYKFTIVPDRDFIDDDKRWQGGDGMCGLDIPEYTSPSQIRSALKNGEAAWGYNPPQGGVKQPMRLGDARLYIYKAVCPIGSMESSYFLRTNNTGYEFDISVEVVVESSDYNLTLNDISIRGKKLSQMYLGVYMVNSNEKYFFGSTSSVIGSNSNLTITLKGDSGTTGDYTAYMFLCTASQAGSEQSGYFYGLHKAAQTIKIQSASTQHILTCHGVWHADGTAFDYEIHIKNNTSSQQTYSGIKIYLGQGTNINAPTNIVSFTPSSTSKTVAANSEAVISGTITTKRNNSVNYLCGAGCTTPSISPVYGQMDSLAPEG